MDSSSYIGFSAGTLDAGCRVIEDELGVTAGDFAGAYWSGSTADVIRDALREYLEAERRQS